MGAGRHPVRSTVTRVEVSPLNVRDAGEMERAFAAFSRSSDGGLIVTSSSLAFDHRERIQWVADRRADLVPVP
jgi:hypothetical protein